MVTWSFLWLRFESKWNLFDRRPLRRLLVANRSRYIGKILGSTIIPSCLWSIELPWSMGSRQMESLVWKMILAGLVFPWTFTPNHVFCCFFLLNHQLFADFFCNMFLFNHHVYEYGISLWIWTIHEYIYIILLYIYIYIQSTLIIINHHSSTFQRNKHPPINSIDPSRRRGQVWSSWRTGRAQLMASLARQQERPGGPEPARCFRYFGGGMTLFGHHSDVIIYN